MFKLNKNKYRYKQESLKQNMVYRFGQLPQNPVFLRLFTLAFVLSLVGGVFMFLPSGADASNTHPVLRQEGYVFSNDDGSKDYGQTIFTDDFTGTDGDPWDSNKWDTSIVGPSGSVDIQSNEGRMIYADTSGDRARAIASDDTKTTDSEVLMKFRFGAEDTGQRFYVWLRSSGIWETEGSNGDFQPTWGYGFLIERGSSDPKIVRSDGPTGTGNVPVLTSGGGTTHQHNSDQWIRFQVIGDTLRAKWWDDGSAEPGSWTLTTTDSTYSSAGVLQLTNRRGSGVAATVTVDDLSFTDYTQNTVMAGSEFSSGKTLDVVRQGERVNLRTHITNTGTAISSTDELGLFYDKGDGLWTRAQVQSPLAQTPGTSEDCEGFIDSGGSADWYCDIITDGDHTDDATNRISVDINPVTDQPWVVTRDSEGGGNVVLSKYVGSGGNCDGFDDTGGSDAWSCETIFDGTNAEDVSHSELAFDKEGNPYIAFRDRPGSHDNLVVAEYVGSGGNCDGFDDTGGSDAWQCTTVLDGNHVADDVAYFQLAVSPSGTPWLVTANDNSFDRNLLVAEYVGGGSGNCQNFSDLGASGSNDWQCTHVVDSDQGDDVVHASISFDGDGNPWISYRNVESGGDDLTVVNYVGGGSGNCQGYDEAGGSNDWQCTTVVEGGESNDFVDNTIRFDPDGNPVVVSRNVEASGTSGGDLIMVEYVGSGGNCQGFDDPGGSNAWQCTTIVDGDSFNDVWRSDFVFDASGNPLITYRNDESGLELVLVNYVGSGGNCDGFDDTGGSDAWQCTVVADGGSIDNPAISIDNGGDIWMASRSVSNSQGDLTVARLDIGGEIQIVPSAVSSGGDSLTKSHADMTSATDTTNRDDADCLDGTATWNQGVYFGTEIGTGLVLPDGNTTPQCTEIIWTLDTSQAIAGATYRFVVATNDAFTADNGPWRGVDSVATDGYPTLTIRGGEESVYRYSKDVLAQLTDCDASGWGCEDITGVDNDFTHSTIGVAPDGTIWIAGFESNVSYRNLFVAKYVGSGGTGCSTDAWDCGDIVTSFDSTQTGRLPDIDFLPDGSPIISFTPNSGDGLYVAEYVGSGGDCDDTAWECTLVDGTVASIGSGSVVDIDDSGVPSIAYIDGTNSQLKLAKKIPSATESGTSISVTQLHNEEFNNSDHSSTSFVTQSISPTSGLTYFVFVSTGREPSPSAPSSVSGWGLTWDQVADVGAGGSGNVNNSRMSWYRASGSPSSGSITVNYSAAQTNAYVTVVEVSGVPTSNNGADALRNVSTNADETNQALLTLPPFASNGNGAIGAYTFGNDNTVPSLESGWTGLSSWEINQSPEGPNGANDGDQTGRVLWRNDNDTTITADWSEAERWAVVGAELVSSNNINACSDAGWTCEVIEDVVEPAGDGLGMAIDDNGKSYISFVEQGSEDDIWIAEHIGSGGSCANTAWNCTQVESIAQGASDLAIDGSGTLWMVFADHLNDTIDIAEYVGSGGTGCDVASWNCDTIYTSASGTDTTPAIAVDSRGEPWVALVDAASSELYVARHVGSGGSGCTSSAWSCTAVDATNAWGDPDIAFDSSGTPWIVYEMNPGSPGIAKMHMPPSQLSASPFVSYDGRSAGSGDLRYRLTSGLAPATDQYGVCGGNTALSGYCGLYHPEGHTDSLTVNANERPAYGFSTRYDTNASLPTANIYFTTDMSPATENVALQVYRYGSTNAWETVSTYSDAGCASENCLIRGLPSGTPSEYFETDGSDYWVHFRVYQTGASSGYTFSVDSFDADTNPVHLRGGRVFREQVSDPLGW